MISDSSPVIDFYPLEFETDLNGKQHDWEAVVLIPFIDEVSDTYFTNISQRIPPYNYTPSLRIQP